MITRDQKWDMWNKTRRVLGCSTYLSTCRGPVKVYGAELNPPSTDTTRGEARESNPACRLTREKCYWARESNPPYHPW